MRKWLGLLLIVLGILGPLLASGTHVIDEAIVSLGLVNPAVETMEAAASASDTSVSLQYMQRARLILGLVCSFPCLACGLVLLGLHFRKRRNAMRGTEHGVD